MRICPDCSSILEPRQFAGVQVDACPRCAGIYFDEGELNRVRRHSATSLQDLDEMVQPQELALSVAALRLCPGCGKAMSKIRYLYSSPVQIDSCEFCCGTWIQNGELKAMQEYLSQSHSTAEAVVAEMQVASQENVARASRLAQMFKNMSRDVRTGL